jgi:hypothetical protein
VCGCDVRPRIGGTVLVAEQPCQRIVHAGFACGALAVDVAHAIVKDEVQLVKALEVHQVLRLRCIIIDFPPPCGYYRRAMWYVDADELVVHQRRDSCIH